jgi:hypothetical protein
LYDLCIALAAGASLSERAIIILVEEPVPAEKFILAEHKSALERVEHAVFAVAAIDDIG